MVSAKPGSRADTCRLYDVKTTRKWQMSCSELVRFSLKKQVADEFRKAAAY